MMKSNEIRKGNFYLKCGKLMVANGTFISNLEAIEKIPLAAIAIEVEPIPITEEWLINFGFVKKYECSNEWVLDDAHYTFHEHNEKHQGIHPKGFAACIRCDYVHELQNISFYVNREELKLKSYEIK